MGGWFEKCCSEKGMKMVIFDGKNMRKQSEIKKKYREPRREVRKNTRDTVKLSENT